MSAEKPAGLTGAPPVASPVTLPRTGLIRQARRRQETATSIARHLGPLLARRVARSDISDQAIAHAFRRVAEDLGASYTKFGQFVASAAGIFGDEVAAEFAGCLDDGPPAPVEQVTSIIERDLERPMSSVFRTFDARPLGSASIAVVHRAVLVDGRTVAVKVLRPNITHTVATDLVLMRQLFTVVGRVASPQLADGLQQGLDNFRIQVREELDLRNESTAMAYYRALLADYGLDRVTVPEPYPEISGRRVLVMEHLDGVAVHDAAQVALLTDDPGPLVAEIVRAWFVMALRSGTFHGDIHAGNLMVLRDGRIAMIDWGIVGRLDPDSHDLFRSLIAGALGDEDALDRSADFFYGRAGAFLAAVGIDEPTARLLIKARTREVFTAPFGQIGFGQMLLTPTADLAGPTAAADAEAPDRPTGFGGMREAMRDGRDLPPPGEIDRSLMLLGKQLMFLESYGKRYLSDTAILDDPDFFRALLAET